MMLASFFLYLLISIFSTQPPLSLVSRGIKWEYYAEAVVVVVAWPREIKDGGWVENNHHVFLEICDLITFTSPWSH